MYIFVEFEAKGFDIENPHYPYNTSCRCENWGQCDNTVVKFK